MGSRHTGLALVRESFPGRESVIERAFQNQPTFRELCRDYRRCASAVDRWQRQNGIGATSRREEYAELLEELGLEIQAWLDATESESTQGENRTT